MKKTKKRAPETRNNTYTDDLVNSIITHGNNQVTRANFFEPEQVPIMRPDLIELAIKQKDEIIRTVQDYQKEVEKLSGYPIRITRNTIRYNYIGKAQLAWKYKRDYHCVEIHPKLSEFCSCHFKCHEFTHIKLEAQARLSNKPYLLVLSHEEVLKFCQSKSYEFAHLLDELPDEKIVPEIFRISHFVLSKLFNRTVDTVIEQYLFNNFPILRPVQFHSVQYGETSGKYCHQNPASIRMFPPILMRAVTALDAAFVLSLDDLFCNATNLAETFKALPEFEIGKKIMAFWKEKHGSLGPGDEYNVSVKRGG